MSAKICVSQILLIALALNGSLVASQEYPSKPIRIYTSPPGGGSDFTARLAAQGLTGLGQPVVVENRASGTIAAEIVAKSPPDGYSLTVNGGGFILTPLLRKSEYDAEKDFAPISLIERSVSMLVVHPSVPIKSAKELIAVAKANPGKLVYSSAGIVTSSHLLGELFKSMAGIDMLHVPFKGSGAALNALLGGDIHVMFPPAGIAWKQGQTGKLRLLAVTSEEPSALAPGLPTIAATGLPGFAKSDITGIYAPAKTPASIVGRLNQQLVRYLQSPDVKERLFKTGVEPVGSSPEQLAEAMKTELATMGKVIRALGVRSN